MSISRLFILLLSLCLTQTIEGQSILSRVTFPINDQQTSRDLAKAGIDLTHGHGKLGVSFTTEMEGYELARLDKLGIQYKVDIPDISLYRHQDHNSTRTQLLNCQDDLYNSVVPKNFEMGKAGGFFSMSDVLDNLDIMQYYYPNLISVRKPIGNFKTWGNNSIFWVKISDNPEIDENEPQILYTGLTHARELISISENIYYMWYLLENYDKDPVVKQIVDHTELYFVPVVNPDGLNYNIAGYDQAQDIFTRNLRKNMRDNDGDGVFNPEFDGVDLNRNFGYRWGYDNEGSSNNEGSPTYRGPSAFSEPETKAIQYFCNTHDFKIALNYHSYGNLLVTPWGYEDLNTIDSTIFDHYGELLTQQNKFVYGRGLQTVGYVSNGDSDDWMYGELGMYSMTPELGDDEDGFYPKKERIIPLCKSTLKMNLLSARLVNSLVSITDETPKFIEAGVNPLNLEFNRYGLLDGTVTISFKSLSPNITQVPSSFALDLHKFEPFQKDLQFTVASGIQFGEAAKIEILCQQGEYTFRDTLTKVRADFSTLVEDQGNMSNWDKSHGEDWGTTSAQFKSPPMSITDSPNGLYGPNLNEAIVLNQQIDLQNVTSAYVQFWARWDIEDEYDYVVFQVSTDGQNWQNLCGERSKLGSIFQLYEQPLYDGKQLQWVLETTDLDAYLGQTIQLRFLLVTDGFGFKDGLYFDDFKVTTINEGTTTTTDVDESAFSVYPNPADNSFNIQIPQLTKPAISVYNTLGREVYTAGSITGNTQRVTTTGWPAGLYQYVIYAEGKPVHNGLVSLMH
ncbi:MAG: immune inhibitor A [Saprospiraceae bacterium]|uniref:carboxypeptidase T n=1 Tax=Candidatus Opimibacter skivensis TaxID=2982028 RepID=A0A9D7XNL2_9BACT|nr:immune inhibitor A [Candidatus Opimibacter skivensis]